MKKILILSVLILICQLFCVNKIMAQEKKVFLRQIKNEQYKDRIKKVLPEAGIVITEKKIIFTNPQNPKDKKEINLEGNAYPMVRDNISKTTSYIAILEENSEYFQASKPRFSLLNNKGEYVFKGKKLGGIDQIGEWSSVGIIPYDNGNRLLFTKRLLGPFTMEILDSQGNTLYKIPEIYSANTEPIFSYDEKYIILNTNIKKDRKSVSEKTYISVHSSGDGKLLWRYELDGQDASNVMVSDDNQRLVVFVKNRKVLKEQGKAEVVNTFYMYLFKFAHDQGSLIKKQELKYGHELGRGYGSPDIFFKNDYAFLMYSHNIICMIDLNSGEIIWKKNIDEGNKVLLKDIYVRDYLFVVGKKYEKNTIEEFPCFLYVFDFNGVEIYKQEFSDITFEGEPKFVKIKEGENIQVQVGKEIKEFKVSK